MFEDTSPLINLVVVSPKIAGNIGALVRLSAATGAALHICGELSFSPQDKRMRRAGLDYWSDADVFFHDDLQDCMALLKSPPFVVEVCGDSAHWEADFKPGSVCVFGPEDGSISPNAFEQISGTIKIPMSSKVRSLNLAQSAAIITYEALRQSSV